MRESERVQAWMSEVAWQPEGRPSVLELWAELSTSMRLLRQKSGMSLRQAELAGRFALFFHPFG